MMRRWPAAVATALCLWVSSGGCNLIDTKSLNVDYAFDPQEYNKSFGSTMGTVPTVACDPAISPDPCAAVTQQLPAGAGVTLSCDGKLKQCVGSAELRLSYVVDLSSQTSFPPEAIQYGINAVDLKKVEYWIMSNTLNVAIPPVDVFVAPEAAKDESGGTKLGSLAGLAARSTTCADPADPTGDATSNGAMVCDLPLTDAGKNALANFAKDYKTKFQFIAHTIVTVKPGDPLPAGGIDFFVRPVISIGIFPH
jgi:hypothetical protein